MKEIKVYSNTNNISVHIQKGMEAITQTGARASFDPG